jgi:monomeric sarcosine oxidase
MKLDVAVIGAGAMGGATAYHLAKSGANVGVFDQFSVPHNKGSSHAETRLIRQAYFENPNYVPLLKRAYELWDDLEDTPGQLFIKNGLFVAGRSDRTIMQGILESSKQHKIPVEILSASEASKRFPGFRFAADETCIFEPNAGYLQVDQCLLAHLRKAEKLGATVRLQSTIDSFKKTTDGFSIKSGDREIKAKKVVVCAGAWAGHMLPEKYKSVLSPHRVPLFWFPRISNRPAAEGSTSCFAFDLIDGFFYGFPQLQSQGVKIGLHKPGMKITNPSAFSRSIADDERDPVKHFIKEKLTYVQPTVSREETCIYTMTPDENFLVDEEDGLVIVAGFSGHGFKFASVIGEIAKDLALNGRTKHPIDFLRFRW